MLELKNVKKSYDGTPVLTDISLNIEDGEIVSILGPSGCGKTTLLNLILGIVDSDGGQIVFDGEDITDVPMEKRGFNIVFQDYALFPNLNVYQNITYGLRNNPEISSKEEVEDLISLLGLEEHLNKRIGQLSGGTQYEGQKVEEGIRKYDEANIIFYSDFARLVDEFRNEEALSPELADAFIEKVLVDKNHNIEVVFKFQDEINMLCMRKAS